MSTQFSSTQPLLTVAQVAEYFSVSKITIHAWMKSGQLRSFKVGGSRRISISDLDKFVEAGAKQREAVTV